MPSTDMTYAKAYERRCVPALSRPLVPRAIDIVAPRPGESVVDLACGTGIAARLIAPRIAPGGHVTGIDSNPAMIAVARAVAGFTVGVTFDWRCASASSLPLDDGCCDIAICIQGLQYFSDRVAALSEVHRIVKPAGRLVTAVWGPLDRCSGHQTLVAAIERRGLDATGLRKTHWAEGPSRLQHIAFQAGFRTIAVSLHSTTVQLPSAAYFLEVVAAESLESRNAIAGLSGEARIEILRELEQIFHAHSGEGIALPLSCLLLVARR